VSTFDANRKELVAKQLFNAVADPGGNFGATAPPQTAATPLTKMRPFFVPIEVKTEAKNTLNQWFLTWGKFT